MPDYTEMVNRMLGNYPHLGLAAMAVRKGLVDPLMEGAALTKDVAEGNIDLQEPKNTARAMAAGPTALAGTMPMAQPGSLGVMGGVGSALYGKSPRGFQALKRAIELDQKGATNTDLWHETGWRKDPHSLSKANPWRGMEIDDSGATFKNLPAPGDKATAPLSVFWDHPELYAHYPDLAKALTQVEVPRPRFKDYPYQGGFLYNGAEKGRPTFFLTATDPKSARSAMTHETQHAVDFNEGLLEPGSSMYYRAPEIRKQAMTNAIAVAKQIGQLRAKGASPESLKPLQDYLDTYNTILKANNREMYWADPIETSARIAQLRRHMAPAERQRIAPEEMPRPDRNQNYIWQPDFLNLERGMSLPKFDPEFQF